MVCAGRDERITARFRQRAGTCGIWRPEAVLATRKPGVGILDVEATNAKKPTAEGRGVSGVSESASVGARQAARLTILRHDDCSSNDSCAGSSARPGELLRSDLQGIAIRMLHLDLAPRSASPRSRRPSDRAPVMPRGPHRRAPLAGKRGPPRGKARARGRERPMPASKQRCHVHTARASTGDGLTRRIGCARAEVSVCRGRQKHGSPRPGRLGLWRWRGHSLSLTL